jgi:hypothetical protein
VTISDRLPWLVLVAASALGACGTVRAYAGPERPRDQIAVVNNSKEARPLPAWGFARMREVDGKPVPRAVEAIEMLPGPHELLVDGAVTDRMVEFPAAGMLRFTAEAGGNYELMTWLGDRATHTGTYIALTDTSTGEELANTKPSPETAVMATFEFDGRRWEICDWHISSGWDSSTGLQPGAGSLAAAPTPRAFVTWLPAGQTLEAWDEMVECLLGPPPAWSVWRSGDPLQRAMNELTDAWENHDPPTTWSELPVADGRALEYHGIGVGAQPQHGLVVLRGDDEIYTLTYASRSASQLATQLPHWLKAFGAATLKPVKD